MINLVAVDDESDVEILFKHFFRKESEEGSVNLKFVLSAMDCLELLESGEYGDNTLVVTDINMPQMNGIELAAKLNEEYPRVKVFLVSAYDARSQLESMKNLEVADYIPKPVNFEELKAKIFQLFPEHS
ncbi:MAG: response regulator [Bacteriovoracaceae bacterium]|nr:response regulator [Bacteriovoracaceae bacterium]